MQLDVWMDGGVMAVSAEWVGDGQLCNMWKFLANITNRFVKTNIYIYIYVYMYVYIHTDMSVRMLISLSVCVHVGKIAEA
jgi:hypothetical protein